MTWGELRNLLAPQGRVLLCETPCPPLQGRLRAGPDPETTAWIGGCAMGDLTPSVVCFMFSDFGLRDMQWEISAPSIQLARQR